MYATRFPLPIFPSLSVLLRAHKSDDFFTSAGIPPPCAARRPPRKNPFRGWTIFMGDVAEIPSSNSGRWIRELILSERYIRRKNNCVPSRTLVVRSILVAPRAPLFYFDASVLRRCYMRVNINSTCSVLAPEKTTVMRDSFLPFSYKENISEKLACARETIDSLFYVLQ